MPRARDPNRDKAFEMWKEHKGEITNREIANRLNVPEKTISAWKSRDKWNAVLQKKERSTTKKNKTSNAKKPPRKRSGNPNPENQFTKRNKAAEKHGLFSKFLPPETLEIMESMTERSTADLIWDQIQIQYAAIIRAQQIMFVESKDEMIKELKKRKDGDNSEEREWEFQFSWERHATFMNAQSRAMSELRSLIKQFDEMAAFNDERRLKLEQMRLNIDKTKAELDNLTDSEDDKPIEIVIKRKE